MERCFHKKESNVMMVGSSGDGGAVYCNVYDQKSKTFCKKLRHACAAHAAKRAQVGGMESTSNSSSHGTQNGNGVIANGQFHKRPIPQTCGCPTGDFISGYLLYFSFLFFSFVGPFRKTNAVNRYCELPRKTCVKHHNWEELMRDSISNQKTQHV